MEIILLGEISLKFAGARGIRKEIVPAGREAFIQEPGAESEGEKDAQCWVPVDGLQEPCGQRGV